jgi:hypothetical protein
VPQLHTYVPAHLAARAVSRAAARGIPVSRYLADLIRRDVDLGWPDAYFERVVGRWYGRPLRRPPQRDLEEREPL